jgi:glycosyltransferase involved in cell wall biosynthesis
VHCASPKGVLYGGMVSRLIKVPSLVVAITGMGYGFTSVGIKKYSIKRSIIKMIFNTLLGFVYSHKNKKIIVQNLDDKAAVESVKSVGSREICLIRGSGVQLSDYKNISFSDKENIIVLPARMLADKGVREFYLAAKRLKHLGCEWRFILAGTVYSKNPSVISRKVIEGWVLEGVVEWLGNVDNMLELYSKASIVCLPSYREGMPKALQEAAAAGCAVITTDAIGCRESINPGISGDLVKVGSFKDLADSIETLINDPMRRKMYGENGQKLAKEFFDINIVINKSLSIYKQLNNSIGSV